MAIINIVDCIPDNKPHCGNCYHWKDCGELFARCDEKNEDCPSFTVCGSWHSKEWNDEIDAVVEQVDTARILTLGAVGNI